MKKKLFAGIVCAMLLLTNICGVSAQNTATPQELAVTQLKGPALDKEYGLGVAFPFVGVVKDTLLIAGGSNFADNTPAGVKKVYKNIYGAVLKEGQKKLTWKQLGELPEPLAGGVSIQGDDALYFLGGTNAAGDKATALKVSMVNNALVCERLPSLPVAASNFGGAYIDKHLYAVGGVQNGKPSGSLYRLSLAAPQKGWEALPALPEEPRIQPIVTAQKDASGREQLYVWGGFDGWSSEVNLLCGGYKFDPQTNKWAPLPAPLKNEKRVYLGGGNALAVGDNRIFAVGGFDYEVLLQSLLKPGQPQKEQDAALYKQNQEIYCYDTLTDKWTSMGSAPSLATVHAGAVNFKGHIYNIEGEIKPGVNTNNITKIAY